VLQDNNVNGLLVGLWSLSNAFHSPTRVTLYRLPYQLRTDWRWHDRVVRLKATAVQPLLGLALCHIIRQSPTPPTAGLARCRYPSIEASAVEARLGAHDRLLDRAMSKAKVT
jgi:hypothetical protein